MRKPRTGEVAGTVAGLSLGAVLGGVLVRGVTDTGSAEGLLHVPQAATIVNTENRKGVSIGVRTYAGPSTDWERGSRNAGALVDVVCIEPDGRKLIDTDVPPSESTDRGNDWYLLTATTDPNRQEWVNTSYVEITPVAGAVAVQECSEIEGLKPGN